MTDGFILGIDTSNYTTSVALVSLSGELVANIKRPLAVKEGERGLRQSDAVFSHVKNLPSCMEEMREHLRGGNIAAVGVSTRPRNIDGSYMPCFLCGVAAAESIRSALGVPLYSFSHQCGHIMAALYSSGREELADGEFAAYHVSGGTTELLHVKGERGAFSAKIVGGTLDLNAGQVIDRIGVRLGLPFPAGVHLEKLALEFKGKLPRKRPSTNGSFINLSGLENMALKLYSDTSDPTVTAAFVLDHIAEALIATCSCLLDKEGELPLVFAGGVMSNSIIKEKIRRSLSDCSFAEPRLSSDNAVGVAVLARHAYLCDK
ncbi:MAG: peptidase M22 [Clostridia bacterium]|nr:peptidase M22 [Clostridia bacterium]